MNVKQDKLIEHDYANTSWESIEYKSENKEEVEDKKTNEEIEKIADEVISIYNVKSGDFDNVLRCRYEVPDYWTIGAVYERLIEDICAENETVDFIVDTLLSVYSSWIDGAISNYNTDFFYQSREYIFESWKEGTVLQ